MTFGEKFVEYVVIVKPKVLRVELPVHNVNALVVKDSFILLTTPDFSVDLAESCVNSTQSSVDCVKPSDTEDEQLDGFTLTHPFENFMYVYIY